MVFYLPEDLGSGFTANYFGFNINGNCIFYSEDNLMAYRLAGINILRVKVKGGGNSTTNSETGLNLGAGVEFAQDFGNIFGELRFAGLGGDLDQLVIGAGVRFPINQNILLRFLKP